MICKLCQQEKPAEEFTTRSLACLSCREDLARATRLRTLFNLSLDEYEQIIAYQDGKCAICKKKPKVGGNRLSVDHDHKTGLVRGGLCWLCNKSLGYMKDDLIRLIAMVDYLTEPPATKALGKETYGVIGRTTNKRKRTKSKTTKKKTRK